MACAAPGVDLSPGERVASAVGGSAAVEVPAWALGGWSYFTVDGRPGGFVSSTGVATMDGRGPWVALLSAGPPEQVARALAGAWGEGRIQFVGTPTLELLDGTGRAFTGTFRAPPSQALQTLRVEARPDVPATLVASPATSGDRVADLLAQVTSTTGPSRVRLVRELGGSGDARAVPVLAGLLLDRWADLRKASATALGTLADPSAVAPLAAALGAERDVFVAIEQIAALRRIGGDAATAALAGVASAHPDAAIRARAAAP
jgi:hypothetical protein